MKKLLTFMAMMTACFLLSLSFTSCGDDDDNNVDPETAWICTTWSAHLYTTKYENDKAMSNNEETINNIKFNKDGTLIGLLDYDHWTLKGNTLTLVNSKNNGKAEIYTIECDQDHFTFMYSKQTETSISDGVRMYAITVFSFRRNLQS